MATRVRWAWPGWVAAVAAACVASASQGSTPDQLYGLIGLTLINFCLIAWVALDDAFESLKTSQVLITAIALGAMGLLTQPLLEDDHFRYLWDGFITASAGNPFAHAPSHYFTDASVPLAMQDALNGINNPDIPTIYGPVLQAVFALCFWMAPAALWPLKLVLLAALIAVVLLLHSAGVSARWLMVLVLHPLMVKESAMTAHPDILLGAALLGAVLAWQRSHHGIAAGLAAIAVAMKFSAAPALLFFCVNRDGRLSVRGCLAMAFVLSVVYAPVLLAIPGTAVTGVTGASAFALQWTFNPLMFKFAAVALGDAAARLACVALFALAWLAMAARWTVRLRALALVVPTGTDARDAGGFVMPFSPPSPPLAGVFVALLLLSPAVNPWYWLWVLPLALLPFSPVVWVAATVSLFSFAHVATQVLAVSSIITYAVPPWATGLQLTAIACALGFAHHRSKRT